MQDIGSNCILLECKSIDPRVKFDAPKPEHRYQTIVQLGVVRETTEFQPRFAVVSYVGASFWDTITEFVVEFDPDVYTNAKARAAKVLTANAASELPPAFTRVVPAVAPAPDEARPLPPLLRAPQPTPVTTPPRAAPPRSVRCPASPPSG